MRLSTAQEVRDLQEVMASGFERSGCAVVAR